MKFADLEPQFLRYEVKDGQIFYPYVHTIAEAQGIEFLCPKCFETNKGKVGTHAIICWSRSRGTPEDATPRPGRWSISGTGYNDLTLGCDAPSTQSSVQLLGGCNWHGHVTNGETRDA